jgi:lysophospholipase
LEQSSAFVDRQSACPPDSCPGNDLKSANPRPGTASGFVGVGGTPIFTQAWLPPQPWVAGIVISHGLAEHSGRYASLAARLTTQGLAVHALDHRGHGQSGNAPRSARANLGRFRDAVADLDTLVVQVADAHPGLPLFLFGHSMGGAIALSLALRHPQPLRGLLLSGPAVATAEAGPGPRLALAKLLAWLAPDTGVLRLPADAISRDLEVVRAYENDPLVHRGAVPARTLIEMLVAMSMLQANAGALRMPVLIMHGSADRLVPLAMTRGVYERIGSQDKTVRIYDGLYHEIVNEPEREQVIGELLAWILDRS